MRLLSTRDLSEALGVSESSLKRWVDSGRIAGSRTEGGHRRIALGDALQFIRESGAKVVRPELLDLPEIAVARERGRERLLDHLMEGDARGARGWLAARYLGGESIAALADGPIRDAMHAVGELWRHDESGVFVEHRATDTCLQALAELRSLQPVVAARAPVAIGGAPAGDPYLIASQLAAMVAGEVGMRAVNLGPDMPPSALVRAAAQLHPRLVWISVTSSMAPARAAALVRALESLPRGIAIVVGGQQAAGLQLPARVRRGTVMEDLAAVARAIRRS
ncbi:MAG: cobalamin-dependent protein [Deltaproteobacteria bacterium]|nr:cobalamin-dependent protein [Deltaproteobacteria bacterium]